jgi:uncharacterized protein YdiU (UPF0061 family)
MILVFNFEDKIRFGCRLLARPIYLTNLIGLMKLKMYKLQQLTFSNRYARLPEHYYSRVRPTPLPAPYLVSFNASAARLIDLNSDEAQRPDFAEHFSGNRLPPDAEPLAMLYAGHQFGQFVPQLGDGRAIMLGEIRNHAGEHWEVQLKGSGVTPYSRRGDGRAVLRSSIREYLCSEAMHALGIPTSRALCIVGSAEPVYRETAETAAVLTRLAPTHVRFGSFEVFAYRGQQENIAALADFVIAHHYPEFADATDKYRLFLLAVTQRTAKLMAQWQAVGFCHGVMNTDNMSILGLTLDYGPFGFMETFDPGYICNHSDPQGRYAYDQQPQVGLWNLACLAHALSKLVDEVARAEILESYAPTYHQHYLSLMAAKLGLSDESIEDFPLIEAWLELLQRNRMDFTLSFRSLSDFNTASDMDNHVLRDQFMDRATFDTWANDYRARLLSENSKDSERKVRMDAVNPKYVLRNHLAQQAIEQAERRDYSEIDSLLALLSKPYDEQPEMQRYAEPPPESARHIVVSCSS